MSLAELRLNRHISLCWSILALSAEAIHLNIASASLLLTEESLAPCRSFQILLISRENSLSSRISAITISYANIQIVLPLIPLLSLRKRTKQMFAAIARSLIVHCISYW